MKAKDIVSPVRGRAMSLNDVRQSIWRIRRNFLIIHPRFLADFQYARELGMSTSPLFDKIVKYLTEYDDRMRFLEMEKRRLMRCRAMKKAGHKNEFIDYCTAFFYGVNRDTKLQDLPDYVRGQMVVPILREPVYGAFKEPLAIPGVIFNDVDREYCDIHEIVTPIFEKQVLLRWERRKVTYSKSNDVIYIGSAEIHVPTKDQKPRF